MLHTVVTVFVLVFLAELGDKTQIATMLLATQREPLVAVFIGASVALVLSSLVGVLAGAALMRVVPAHILRMVAGAGFLLIGVLLLSGKV